MFHRSTSPLISTMNLARQISQNTQTDVSSRPTLDRPGYCPDCGSNVAWVDLYDTIHCLVCVPAPPSQALVRAKIMCVGQAERGTIEWENLTPVGERPPESSAGSGGPDAEDLMLDFDSCPTWLEWESHYPDHDPERAAALIHEEREARDAQGPSLAARPLAAGAAANGSGSATSPRRGGEVREQWSCRECGSPLVDSRSGSICPNGHGSVLDHLPAKVKRRNHAKVYLGLLDARQTGSHWIVPGEPRPFKLVRKLNRTLNAWPKDVPRSHALALDGSTILELEPA